jgi:hypothetical protein
MADTRDIKDAEINSFFMAGLLPDNVWLQALSGAVDIAAARAGLQHRRQAFSFTNFRS